jgi:hypothetical protein
MKLGIVINIQRKEEKPSIEDKTRAAQEGHYQDAKSEVRPDGITKVLLRDTWYVIRKELPRASRRDVVDYLDYDVEPDVWIERVLSQLSSGQYQPKPPFRFTLGKSGGFSRTMTQPSISDLVLYRAIVDKLYNDARERENKHVYLRLPPLLAQAQQRAAHAKSQRTIFAWLKYARYRRQLIGKKARPYVVLTDISTFFDSLLHSHVHEALRDCGVETATSDLLFQLLNCFSTQQNEPMSHGIGLPVDEFDGSRTLAHLTLFSHDDRMAKLVGEDNYIRWVDDQNLAVSSHAEGLRVLCEVGNSLANLHLSPSVKKSRVLTMAEARRHFHLDIHRMLNNAETRMKRATTRRQRRRLASVLRVIWRKARCHEGTGEFDKVLRRFYKLAGIARLRFLRGRALQDVLTNPRMVGRICDYMRSSGTVSEYLNWGKTLMHHEEQIYPDVNIGLTESLLRLEPKSLEVKKILELGKTLLSKTTNIPGASECQALAPLIIFRFGGRRCLSLLQRILKDEETQLSASVVRSVAVVCSSYGIKEFGIIRHSRNSSVRLHSTEIVNLISTICRYTDVPYRFNGRLRLRYDLMSGRQYLDTRSLMTLRLFMLSRAPRVVNWVSDWKAKALAKPISVYDRLLINRFLK